MMSNSLTRILGAFFLGVFLTFVLDAGLGQTPIAPLQAVKSAVKVEGQTKTFNGQTYQLVAVWYDARDLVFPSFLMDVVWLINGQNEGKSFVIAPDDLLPGSSDVNIRLFWIRLPDHGPMEFLVGACQPEKGESPANVRQKLLAANWRPYIVEIDKLPALKVRSAQELEAEFRRLLPNQARQKREQIVTALAKLKGRNLQFQGKSFQLMAVYYDSSINLMGTNTMSVFWLINRQGEGKDFLDPRFEAILPGKLDPHVKLLWLHLPKRGNVEVLAGVTFVGGEEDQSEKVRWQLRASGYRPLTINVADIPEVKAQSAEEVSQAMNDLAETMQKRISGKK